MMTAPIRPATLAALGWIAVLSFAPSALFGERTAQRARDNNPIRVTDEEVDSGGGIPKGWTFRLPAGDLEEGRTLFVELGCQQCHVVKGAGLPELEPESSKPGPELTGIGSEPHPPEYLAEHIVNPNRVILVGDTFSGKDNLSIMPSFSHVLTVENLADLVAFLQSLKVKDGKH